MPKIRHGYLIRKKVRKICASLPNFSRVNKIVFSPAAQERNDYFFSFKLATKATLGTTAKCIFWSKGANLDHPNGSMSHTLVFKTGERVENGTLGDKS